MSTNFRVLVNPDLGAYGISITIGEKTDHGLLVLKPMVLEYELASPAVQSPPSMRISDETAKALLEALTLHYGGVQDLRTLREDYLHERERVDKLVNHLMGVQNEQKRNNPS